MADSPAIGRVQECPLLLVAVPEPRWLASAAPVSPLLLPELGVKCLGPCRTSTECCGSQLFTLPRTACVLVNKDNSIPSGSVPDGEFACWYWRDETCNHPIRQMCDVRALHRLLGQAFRLGKPGSRLHRLRLWNACLQAEVLIQLTLSTMRTTHTHN